MGLKGILKQNALNIFPPTGDLSMGGYKLTDLGTPTAATDAANKGYVDAFVSGLTPLTACRVATTTALTVTYSNGAAGVGATLTNAGVQAAISIDGVSLSSSDRVLVKNQAPTFQNGIYTVTTVGSGAVNWVLTRATDFNSSSNITEGSFTNITAGSTNTGEVWLETGSGPFTIGTTPIIFTLFGNFGTMATQNANAVAITGGTISAALTGTTSQIKISTTLNAIDIPATGSLVIGDTGAANTTDTLLTAAGYRALHSNTTGTGNTAFGHNSLALNTQGNYNTGLGYYALNGNITGINNTAIGFGALQVATLSGNTAFGLNAGNAVSTGQFNTLIGGTAGSTLTSGSSNIIIGYNIQPNSITADNQINIGGVIKGDISTKAINLQGSLSTIPTDSHTATTAFGASLTLGTALQNTTGYNLLVNIVLSVTVAASATIVMGVGPTNTPTTDTAVSTFSITGDFTLCALVPNNYYLLVNKTGTLTSTNNIIATPI